MWYLLLSHLYSYQSQTTAMANIASPATHNSSFLSPQKAETLRGRHANIYKEMNTQMNMLLKRTPALEVQIFPCLVPSEHQNDRLVRVVQKLTGIFPQNHLYGLQRIV